MNVKSKNVEIKHFLKADSYNEEYRIVRNDSGSENTKIINGHREFFENIILKYDEQQNPNKYYIKLIDDNTKVYCNQVFSWIQDNVYDAVDDTLIYVEGYAGCGKTTWVQSILYNSRRHNYQYILDSIDIADSEKETHKDCYINFYSSFTPGNEYSLDVIRYNLINSIVIRMVYWLKKDSGIEILERFSDFLSDSRISMLNGRLPNVAKPFRRNFFVDGDRKETFFHKNARLLKDDKTAEENFVDIFRENINKKDDTTGEYIFSLLDILCIDCIWRLSQKPNEKYSQEKIFICYDNLDIIDDLEALADFINTLGNLKTNINSFRESYDGEISIPYFVFFATCRKITGAKLKSSGLRLDSEEIKSQARITDSNEAAERDQRRENIIKIELSNLYSYENMAKKRARYFRSQIDALVDFEDAEKMKKCLGKVADLPEGAFEEINYSGLWNHNHRACNNVLSSIVSEYLEYYDRMINEYKIQQTNKYYETISANTSILLHLIIKILNKNKEWEKSLGYKDNKLTTMSRLILTYMHNRKSQDVEDVTISEIIKELGSVNLDLEDSKENDENIIYICTCIQNMLSRLPNEKEEIWRRPLFYKHYALTCENKDIQKELFNQIKDKSSTMTTSFVISDEGSTFVEKIVPQFEFYSARLNKKSIPIFCISDEENLKENIQVVYEKVKQCCSRQIIFMKRYNEAYKIKNISDYLSKDFHPTTVKGNKQLHIIRVIFSHISFLNSFRDYLYQNKDKRFYTLNKTIVMYIYKYLKLYDENFYDIMLNTIGAYNNDVWNEIAMNCNKAIDAVNKDNGYGASIERLQLNDSGFKLPKLELVDFDYIG